MLSGSCVRMSARGRRGILTLQDWRLRQMSTTMRTKVINSEVVIAYSHCPRKAFLLHCTDDRGTPNDYARIIEKQATANRTAYLETLQRTATPTCSYKNEA